MEGERAMTLGTIENTFEVEVTPEQLFELANRLEHQAKVVLPGQVIRVKLNSDFCLVYKPKIKLAAVAVESTFDRN